MKKKRGSEQTDQHGTHEDQQDARKAVQRLRVEFHHERFYDIAGQDHIYNQVRDILLALFPDDSELSNQKSDENHYEHCKLQRYHSSYPPILFLQQIRLKDKSRQHPLLAARLCAAWIFLSFYLLAL